jgi:outer membrane protein assembly factor BamB
MRAAIVLLLFLVSGVRADDWPQWLGPKRDGVWRETGIVQTFPTGGPKVRWRAPVNAGYTGPAVANGRVYLMDRKVDAAAFVPRNAPRRGGKQGAGGGGGAAAHQDETLKIPGNERVLCFNEADGKLIWEHAYDCPYSVSYASGPRVTPVVSDGKVYTIGTEGHVFCFDAEKGTVLWSRDYKKDFGARTPIWGFAGHPLLDGKKLICLAGGEGSVAVALDKDNGEIIWKALSAREPGYCPPTIIEAGGTRQLIIWHPQAVNSLDPETGKVYWSHPWEIRAGLSIPTPRQAGDLLLLTSFYNSSTCFKLHATKPDANVLWEGNSFSEKDTRTLHSIMSTPYIEDGYIYGVCSYGQLRCLKLENGERVWETFAATTGNAPVRWANAFLIKHENRFFVSNENGELIIANLSPKGYEEISRTRLLEPTNTDARRMVVWSHPAFANKSVYMRNDKEMVCVSLAAE